MVYKMADLEWKSSRMYRQEPTGDFTTNRNGRRVPVTNGTEYVATAAAGTMPLSEWYRRMETAVQAEGKQEHHCPPPSLSRCLYFSREFFCSYMHRVRAKPGLPKKDKTAAYIVSIET